MPARETWCSFSSVCTVQIPIPADQDPLDPKNFEPDGMDETILPADVTAGEDGPGNLIKDDEIGIWLDRIRAKGTHVLIIFDSCHSGTMTRGVDVERPRFVEPLRLGVKEKDLARAAQKSELAVKNAKAEGRDLAAEDRSLQTAKRLPIDGSLVAFFAAQPFETEPELPFPEGSPQTREHYFGLSSYTLLQALGQRQSLMTYRDLRVSSIRAIPAYRARGGQRRSAKATWTANSSGSGRGRPRGCRSGAIGTESHCQRGRTSKHWHWLDSCGSPAGWSRG